MEITTGAVALSVRDMRCGDMLTIQHVRVEASQAHLHVPFGTGPCRAELIVTLTVTEQEINRVLSAQGDVGVREPKLSLLNGSLRVTGRYEFGFLAVPFSLVGVPQVEGGERIRLDVREVSIVGAGLPGFSAQMIGEKVNARLSETLNVRHLGLPVRLRAVRVETGRVNLEADAELEWRPGAPDALPR